MYLYNLTERLVYFIYVRKSTDTEDKQVLSIAAQIIELKGFAKRRNRYIADIIIEKQTAKKPGRPKLNKMLERIENGEANGVLAWLPDRLSTYCLDELNSFASIYLPCGVFSNQKCGNFKSRKTLMSSI